LVPDFASDFVPDLASAVVPVFVSVAAAGGATSVRAAATAHQLAVRFCLITDPYPPRAAFLSLNLLR
jgi:hypothetical protein